MCPNRKVIAGLVAVGIGVWAVAPNLLGAAVPLLLVAACPLSMLFMMWGMGGMGGGQATAPPRRATPAGASVGQQPSGSLAALRSRSVELQARHERIAREIARLEAEGAPAVRAADAAACGRGGGDHRRAPVRRRGGCCSRAATW